MHHPIIIIGNGIAGSTAARELRKKSADRIVMISEEYPYFISRPALMYVYMGHMQAQHLEPYERNFWAKNRIELLQKRVRSIDAANHHVLLDDGSQMSYSKLILATGSLPRPLGLENEEADGIVNLYHWRDLQKIETFSHSFGTKKQDFKINEAVIVGGGLIGVELAEMLHTRGIQVTMIIRDTHFWGSVVDKKEAALIQQQLDKHHIRTIYSSGIGAIKTANGGVRSVVLTTGENLPCQLLGITIGVMPQIDLAQQSGISCDKGILVDTYLRTNATDVFAVGDCAQLQNPEAGRKSVEAVWYTGKMMGETVAHNITGQQRPYQPGIWFNSAKFFQLEYQTYGQVSVNENSQEAHYHWIADGLHQALKFSYHPQTTALLGITNWGMRLRQDEIYQAIRHGLTLHQVIKTLDHYLFDAEFTPSKKANIELHFNQQASTTQHV